MHEMQTFDIDSISFKNNNLEKKKEKEMPSIKIKSLTIKYYLKLTFFEFLKSALFAEKFK